MATFDHDFIIIGSGFGGSPSALRLVDKGYDVMMLEAGSELGAEDFPDTNWNFRRWLWLPALGFRGLFRMTFFRHVTILSGAGVGGGSLGYACTHPVPARHFFEAPSWAHLAGWEHELAPHYEMVQKMLGVTAVPFVATADTILKELAEEDGRASAFSTPNVAVYFGKPGETVPDPYFGGEGPSRTGCIRCGGCMLGCQHNAKNSLDKNYLYLARKRGLKLQADTEVTAIRPLAGGGYRIEARQGRSVFGRKNVTLTAQQVIVAGGVLGSLKLLHRMRADPLGLPKLSPRLGDGIRTNEEALIYVVSQDRDADYSKGVAIGSLYETDPHSHLEIVRYSRGSGAFRLLLAPHVPGESRPLRAFRLFAALVRNPIRYLRAALVPDLARFSAILLYMRSTDSTLRLVKRRFGSGLATKRASGPAPKASIPEATALAARVAHKLNGVALSGVPETLLNIPTTAHILGGCCMGSSADDGVIDSDHRVFGYEGLYVIDGSAVSANPGVNPSLTIAALAERAMSNIPARDEMAASTPLEIAQGAAVT